jgi:alkylation response protein AidB-like acyl-CoA dehydrogenase
MIQMSVYKHPYKEADFVIRNLLEFDQFCTQYALEDINSDFTKAVLAEAEKFALTQLVDLNRLGDLQPAQLEAEKVIETPGFSQAYQKFVEQGWPSLSGTEQYGGQGLPNLLSVACNEIWQSANLAFSLCPLLGQGAITAIEKHGSDALKEQFLSKLTSGEWTGTMNLTEAGAGTDLAAIQTSAVLDNGQYKITGQKIFITWGDHQMAENIVHLVLARLPDAPAGMKGISLFIVPKYLLDDQGQPKVANDLRCLSLEHKLGIHGSPTCVMSYGENSGAIGYLVGEEHCGIRYMFSMMNHARQGVAVQGLGVSERAYQEALEYAINRVQGRDKQGNSQRIVQFGDVRRMLMMMKSGTEAMRALCYYAGFETDKKAVQIKGNNAAALAVESRIAFLTPIVKGWCTELTQELVSFAMQVHGGAGYIEETGVAQHVRDARILTIYEGTTGIQALDLTIRKTLLDNGAQAELFFAEIEQTIAKLVLCSEAKGMHSALASALVDAQKAVLWLQQNPEQGSCVAAYYLELWGYLMGGWLMANSLLAAQQQLDKGVGDNDYLKAKLVTSEFYSQHYLVRTKTCLASIRAGGDTIMSLTEQQFFSHVN